MPRAWGGPEVTCSVSSRSWRRCPATPPRVVRHDRIGSGTTRRFLAETEARAMYPELDSVTAVGSWACAGAPPPAVGQCGGPRAPGCPPFSMCAAAAMGRGRPGGQRSKGVDGGYGCRPVVVRGQRIHARRRGSPARCDENGRPRPRPGWPARVPRRPAPAGQVTVHDTWHTTGLCGSGSHDYSVGGQFVPAGQSSASPGPTGGDPVPVAPGCSSRVCRGCRWGWRPDALRLRMTCSPRTSAMPEMILARDEPRCAPPSPGRTRWWGPRAATSTTSTRPVDGARRR